MGDLQRMLEGITDVHIKTEIVDRDLRLDRSGSLLYPGALCPDERFDSAMQELLGKCRAIPREDFMVELGGVFFRGFRDTNAVDGTWFRLRKMAESPPQLDTLPSPMPLPIRAALLDPSLQRGGLILIAGGPGCGKTTTGSAIVVSRLKAFGGVAYTVEDPPEMPLNGRHGQGYCTQTMVKGEGAANWVESMRGVLRSQPVGSNLMLFLGEVRDAETARTMVRAASNGFLVICTTFGTDLVSSVDSLYQLLGQEYANSLSAVIRLVVYQKILPGGRFVVESLVSEGASSRVAAIIRSRTLNSLRDEILYQRNAMAAGQNLFAVQPIRG